MTLSPRALKASAFYYKKRNKIQGLAHGDQLHYMFIVNNTGHLRADESRVL